MTAPATEQNIGQSGWHHMVKTAGDMGRQIAGANGAIKMTGGKRRSRKGDKRQSKKQSQKGGKRHRQSKKQRGGRR